MIVFMASSCNVYGFKFIVLKEAAKELRYYRNRCVYDLMLLDIFVARNVEMCF